MSRIIRRSLLIALGIAALGLLLLGWQLVAAHRQIRAVDPPIPPVDEIAALRPGGRGPLRLSYANTATQPGVAGGSIAHPAFLLEWGDGRRFVIDTGMDRAGAEAFSKPFELLGSDPIAVHGDVAQQLGARAELVEGVAFTHLHADHTGGFSTLCRGGEHRIPVFQTHWQREELNYGTRPGSADLDAASCTQRVLLEEGVDGAPVPIPGFPDLFAIAGGGHTPGSTIYAAVLPEHTWIFAGDVTNAFASITNNQPKALLYRLFIVPEDPDRLETLRVWLNELDQQSRVTVVVAHDLARIVEVGIPDAMKVPGAAGESAD